MSANDDGDVGYKKPPKSAQFQPGHSGNPNGRPKGRAGFYRDLIEALDELVDTPHGRRSKQRAVIDRIVDGALSGNTRSLQLLMAICAKLPKDAADEEGERSPEDADLIAENSTE
jgi:hypothetical protein